MLERETTSEAIAILGIGCRYPQAAGVEALWRLLLDGRDAIGPYPGGRFRDLDAAYAAAAKGTGGGGIATHMGGFFPNIDKFDAGFFGISPREAAFVDPQQRLLLEVSWDALEDAGQVREKYLGSRTGVFAGLWNTDYEQHLYRIAEKPEFYMLTGGGRSTASGRVSFTFGFEGPSVSVDTACSSSMVAIHLACQSLRSGECDMALAGGANVILATDVTRLFTNAGMLAPDGRCKFGDKSANGFVRSEGAGMLVLKRLSDAEAAGDAIYAVIRGSSVNNDGRSSGLMVTPSREGQQRMLLQAWEQAGVTGADLCYLEAHGTGTHVGDPVEVGAIADALSATGATGKVPVGSIKSNLGHTESAAGVAGVIKTALVLLHGIVPPSLHCDEPNPEIDWADGPVEVVREVRQLREAVAGHSRVAGASSFGLTGTNSHMLLGEYAEIVAAGADGELPAGFLIPITAYTAEALRGNAARWVEFLGVDGAGTERTESDLAEISFAAGARRTHLEHRFAAVGRDAAELRGQFEALLAGEASGSPEAGVAGSVARTVVFVCPGQGSQWDGMARELLRENAVFRASLTACDGAIAAETGWSLIERLKAPEAAVSLTEIDFVQPTLFAMSVALAAVWRAAGMVPGAVVGHSMGEVAAAHLAGILTLEDAARVICRRSRLMRRLSGTGSGSGAMASVELPAAEVETWLGQFAGRVSIAAVNSPGTTVVAGESDAIDQLLEWLELKEVFCRRIRVDVASHSAMVDPILAELEAALADLRPQAAILPFFSTVNGAYASGHELGAAYWVRNLREPVKLAAATRALADEGYGCFVELSPHPVLVPALENTLGKATSGETSAIALPSLVRGSPAWPAMLRSLGRFWIAGGRLDWAALAGRGDGPLSRRLRLPEYAFEAERFWIEEGEALSAVAASTAKLSPLLRSRTDPANETGTALFAVIADLKTLPYLVDHRVGGAIVFPASAHLEVAMEAAQLMAPGKSARLEKVAFVQALYLAETETPELQLVVRRVPGLEERYRFSLMGRQGTGAGGWTEHSTGVICLGGNEPIRSLVGSENRGLAGFAVHSGTGEEHYRKARRIGLEYGPAFQLVESFETDVASGALRATTTVRRREEDREYLLHPALLDGCFQAMVHLLSGIPGVSADDVYLPATIGELRVVRRPAELDGLERLRTVAVLRSADTAAGTMEFGLELQTEAGELLAAVEGMKVQRVESRSGERAVEDLFALSWKSLGSLPAAMPGGSVGRHWLIFAEAEAGAELARRLTRLGGRCTLVWQGDAFLALGAGERRLDLLGADEYELPLEDEVALDRLLGLVTAEAGRISDVVNFWTLARVDNGDFAAVWEAQQGGVRFVPPLVQAITRAGWASPPQLWLLTCGTQWTDMAVPVQLAGSPVWGMGAVLMREHPELRTVLVDLGNGARNALENGREIDALARLVLEGSAMAAQENRIALRGESAFAARLVPCLRRVEIEEPKLLVAGEAFRVETERPGALDQLRLRAVAEVLPGADEVVVEVAYTGLNFIDVTKALGIYPGLDPKAAIQMGGECSGRVVAVGADVRGFAIGDAVVAVTPSPTRRGLLASRVSLPSGLTRRVPDDLSLEEAAGLPIAYLTAHYSLNELARLQRGEWVLVHAGAGGVGLAAAKIAMALGAKVIATASSPEKHAFLKDWGVEYVLQSRTLEFADSVMEITGGRGVDVVLNSLAGDFIPKSIEVLAPYGRFVELGKRDIYEDKQVGLKGFRNNIAYFAVDLAALIEDKPEYAARLFREVMDAVGSGDWAVLPVKSFAVGKVIDAFQYMAQGRHIGKLAVQFAGAMSEVRVLPVMRTEEPALFKEDATYLITGGLGGVGAAVAEWMVANGARHLVLVSRRAAGVPEHELLERIRGFGAEVAHRRTDLRGMSAVEGLIGEIGMTMPPLKGIFHAAAVIDDALLMDMTEDRYDAVFEPKMRGTWHLHEATLGLELDYFVLFSSIASIFPQPGHGSYAAANAFLDAFAGYRRGLGLAACSINWAGWLGMGLATETGTSRTIEAYDAEGLGSFAREKALAVLGEALRADPVQALAAGIDSDRVCAGFETVPALLRGIVGLDGEASVVSGSGAGAENPLLVELAALGSQGERLVLLEQLLRVETGRVLKLAPGKIGSNQAFGQLGIDSLMALELIRRVNAALGLALPATAVFNYPTLTVLAGQVLKRLGLDEPAYAGFKAAATTDSAGSKAGTVAVPHLAPEELSEDEALRALMEPGEGAGGD